VTETVEKLSQLEKMEVKVELKIGYKIIEISVELKLPRESKNRIPYTLAHNFAKC